MAAISKTCITHRKKEEKSWERQRAILQNLPNTERKTFKTYRETEKDSQVKCYIRPEKRELKE